MAAINVGDWLSQGEVKPSDPCGLFIDGGAAAIPLRQRDIQANVCVDACYADTCETFSYASDFDCTATFKFPLPPRSAVYSFKARIGDREVVTQVKPKAQAQEEYRLAVEQGHSAVLMAQALAASLFEVSVGNLAAMAEAVVEVRYLRMLDAISDALEWVHTATWVPPYIGSAGDQAAGLQQAAAAEPKFASKVSYTLSYAVTVHGGAAGAVRAIESPEPVTVTQPSPTTHLVRLSEEVADPSKDLTLIIELAPGARTSALRVQRVAARPDLPGGEARTVALATFVPRIAAAGPGASSSPAAAAGQVHQELWLVVDCSGSMGGSPIQQAREAALFFVKDLPANSGVRFNITCFGSGHTSLYGACRPYDAGTEEEAVAWIQKHVEADMGGTEILATLEHIYACPLAPGYKRTLIFLTDGGISGSEEQAVYDLVAKGNNTAGGGGMASAASLALRRAAAAPVKAVAKAGKGLVAAMVGRFSGHSSSGAGAAAGAAATTQQPVAAAPEGVAAAETADPPAAEDTAAGQQRDGAPPTTTVLCLGIGHGVHCGLLDGMSSRSEGAAVYVVDDEAIARKAAYLKKCALAAGALVRPRLVARGALVRAVPHVMPQRIFAGEPFHVLLEVLNAAPDATLELTAELPCGGAASLRTFSLPLGPELLQAQAAASAATAGEGRALAVLHAMAYIGSLVAGTSPLHVKADGTPLAQPPAADTVRDTIVRLAVAEHLVTPHTSAVGVLLRRDPLDPSAVQQVEVPLQVPAGRALWGTASSPQGKPGYGGGGFIAQQCMSKRVMLCAAPRALKKCAAAAPTASAGCGAGRGAGNKRRSSASTPMPRAMQLDCAAPPMAFDCTPVASVSASVEADDDTMRCSSSRNSSPAHDPAGPSNSSAGSPLPRQQQEEGGAKEEAGVGRSSGAGGSGGRLAAGPLVSYLNLHRNTQGYWAASAALMAALGLPHDAAGAEAGTRPAGLGDDAWATVLVLASLRKAAGGQRDVWADMEAKALAWLAGVWPAGAKGVGATVLAAMKLMAAA